MPVVTQLYICLYACHDALSHMPKTSEVLVCKLYLKELDFTRKEPILNAAKACEKTQVEY